MSSRKIRLTLSGDQVQGIGPLVDIDFNNDNLDIDLDVGAVKGVDTLIKEYTVDVPAGVYNLDIIYKNDTVEDLTGDGSNDEDRNLHIEKIEYANDGINYQEFIVTKDNTNLEIFENFEPMGWLLILNPNFNKDLKPSLPDNPLYLQNSNYDNSLPRTDDPKDGWILGTHPGSNPMVEHEYVGAKPVTVWENRTATFSIKFE